MSSLRAAAIFSDHMVIQMGKPIKVWGLARSGRTVTVSFMGNTAKSPCIKNRWEITLPPVCEYGGAYELTISDGTEDITFTDVTVGEVWIAGGQSNMEFELQNEKHGNEALSEISGSDVRFYYTKKNPYMDEFFYIDERDGGWMLPDSESAKCWSAVGYYFGRKLASDLGVTVGIIGCNWGGTSASAWIDENSLRSDRELCAYTDDYEKAMEGKTVEEYEQELDDYNEYVAQWEPKIAEFYAKNPNGSWDEAQEYAGPARYPEPLGPRSPFRAGGLYQTMLKRIAPYSSRGFIYYQGESDDHRPDTYEKLLRLLITQWRSLWNDDEMPFINVQLPMHRWRADPDHKNWCTIRQAQLDVYRTVRNTGLAVALDCGEFDNIHPVEKTVVGERLALQALYMTYHRISADEACAPVFRRAYSIDESTVRIEFENTNDISADNMTGREFELAGNDGIFHTAENVVWHKNTAEISSSKVTFPKRIRFMWTNYDTVTVFGANGLPAAPFTAVL